MSVARLIIFSARHGVSKETIRSDLNILAEMGWYNVATAVRLFCGEVCNRN
jgi:DeoR/GlpR family transcriptional regulator of sugar metabolism